jgi:hypothetical protein
MKRMQKQTPRMFRSRRDESLWKLIRESFEFHHYYGEHITFRLFADAKGNQLRSCITDEDEWDDLVELVPATTV